MCLLCIPSVGQNPKNRIASHSALISAEFVLFIIPPVALEPSPWAFPYKVLPNGGLRPSLSRSRPPSEKQTITHLAKCRPDGVMDSQATSSGMSLQVPPPRPLGLFYS